MAKKFKIEAKDIVRLIENGGGCLATDRIKVDGAPLSYMYRAEPVVSADNGWRFFAGDEDEAYLEDTSHTMVYDVNTIANYEPAILAYLHHDYGTRLERVEGTNRFEVVVD